MTDTTIDVRKLAELARVAVSDAELAALEHDMQEIIALCTQIQESGAELTKDVGAHYNALRDDGVAHDVGVYTHELVAAMPAHKDGYLQVRKIIAQD